MVSKAANRFPRENTMFADSILETTLAQRSRRNWTTLTSFALEAVAIALLLLLPLWKTVGLPSAKTVSTPISLGRPMPETAPVVRSGSTSMAPTPTDTARFLAPGRVPRTIPIGPDSPTAPPGGPGGGFIGTGLPSGAGNAIPVSIFSGSSSVLPTLPPPTVHVFRTSNILEGSLIRRVQPVYPPLARAARIQGAVVLLAVISRAGTIDNLRLMSGHPMLAPAAIDAVSRWLYRPYILNGEPIEVETQITVNFTLGN
jgi:periplasmic protein TonB